MKVLTCAVIVLLVGTVSMAQYHVTLPSAPAQKVTVIHTTDLYYAPWDWDDVNDATVWYGLAKGGFADLKAFVMDEPFDGWNGALASRGDGRTWQGIYRIATGIDVPYYSGLRNGLSSTTDTGSSQAANYRVGRDKILEIMSTAADHSIVLDAVGSPRDIAAAYNLSPSLFTQKVKAIYLSGGKEGVVGAGDANWGSDAKATKQLLISGLPVHIGMISSSDSRHDATGWSLDVPALLSITDVKNPDISKIVHWSYYGSMDGGYRAAHGLAFPDRPTYPANIAPPDLFTGNHTMANPQAFFDEPTIPAIDAEIRTAGKTKAMWSPINFYDALGWRIFKNGNDIKVSYNDVEPGYTRVGYYYSVVGTVDGSDVFTYADTTGQGNMNVFKWETASRGEYGNIMNAVYREVVGTYLPEPATIAMLALGGAALLRRRRR